MISRDSVWEMRFYWVCMINMEFTKEIVIDCYEQAKVDNPQTNEEINYSELLDHKIIEEWTTTPKSNQ